MSPESITHSGSVGRAAPGAASRRDAARADDFRVIARCMAVMGFVTCVLVFNAPELWPHLFAP